MALIVAGVAVSGGDSVARGKISLFLPHSSGLGPRGRHHPSSGTIITIKVYIKRVLSVLEELCESRGGRPGLSVLTSLMVSVDVKQY